MRAKSYGVYCWIIEEGRQFDVVPDIPEVRKRSIREDHNVSRGGIGKGLRSGSPSHGPVLSSLAKRRHAQGRTIVRRCISVGGGLRTGSRPKDRCGLLNGRLPLRTCSRRRDRRSGSSDCSKTRQRGNRSGSNCRENIRRCSGSKQGISALQIAAYLRKNPRNQWRLIYRNIAHPIDELLAGGRAGSRRRDNRVTAADRSRHRIAGTATAAAILSGHHA